MDETPKSGLVGVMGWPVSHSLSPRMHNAAFAALRLDWTYVPLPVPPERLADAVRGLVALGFAGANATIPHKTGLVSLMDELTPTAAAIGAVNTIIVRPDGSLLGDSTDGYGFLADLAAHGLVLQPHVEATGRSPLRGSVARALVIGAGGAARAIVHALAQAGVTVAVASRTVAAAAALCETISAHPFIRLHPLPYPFPQALPDLAADADLVVNATSLGLQGDAEPMPWDPSVPFHAGQVVYDLIYHVRTPFLQFAEQCGARAIDGLGMLVHQGARSFELWTGSPAPVAVMAAAIRAPRGETP